MENINTTEPVLSSCVKNYIDSYIEENSLENVKVDSRSAVSKGNNFMSIIDRVTVTGVKNGKDIKISFIAKVPISDEALHNMFSLRLFFEREIYMYKEIAKLYDDIQTNIPVAEKFKFPKCYLANSTESERCILLVDLLKEDFKLHHRLKRVDFEHATLAMEALGKMHAMSFYLQENMKEKFEGFKETLDDVVVATFHSKDMNSSNKYLEVRLAEFLSVLDTDEHKERLKQLATNLGDHIGAVSLPGPYTVIVHGDFWVGNMLFKYENNKPVEIRLLDYQMSRFASPVLDLAYFIACCTDGEFRKLYYDDILEVYYNALSKHLSQFSIKVSDVYPRRVFYEQLKKYFAFGISSAIINLVNATRDEENAVDMVESLDNYMNENNKLQNKTPKLFKDRANELVRDCISYGYL